MRHTLEPPAMPLLQRVFQKLDARQFRSGEDLAADLSVTRAAVWKAAEQLRELGVSLEAAPNRGYKLGAGVTALSVARIEEELAAEERACIESLQVEWTMESTNSRLLQALPPAAGKASVLLAEHQTDGRGRRGRGWVAPPGGAICLSLGWQYPDMPAELSALSLLVGLCVVDALAAVGVRAVQLKWPNDLLTPAGKLGGILIEMRAESGGPVHVVIGIGLNVLLDDAARSAVRDTGTVADDIRAHSSDVPDRNRIVAALLAQLLPALADFPRSGLTPHLDAWRSHDVLAEREVLVENAGEITRGVARGIDTDGALLVETSAGLRRFVSGEVSVRIDR